MKKLLLIAVLLLLVLAACGPGAHAIREGTLRDTVFSIEPRQNGTTSIWFTHDDVGAYCTRDGEIVATAQLAIRSTNSEVIATYRSINNNDPEYGGLLNAFGGCANDKGTTIYLLLSLRRVGDPEG